MRDRLPFELLALKEALQYQQWIIKAVQPYLGKRILELGAGIGNMSHWLTSAEHLVLTEYDAKLLDLLKKQFQSNIKIRTFDLEKQSFDEFKEDNFDTIVSFNVLEHIADDARVFEQCAQLMRRSHAKGKKRIITFVPSHAWAYGVMDKAVGHHRRYNQKILRNIHQKTSPDANLIIKPFNFVGLWGWFLNGRILRRQQAGAQMIGLVDALCPLFQCIDRLVIDALRVPLGQSLIVVQEWL